jgi:hypothetical protein
MVYREEFSEFGIKNAIWLVVLIVISSWIWYFFVAQWVLDPYHLYETPFEGFIATLLDIFPGYFIRFEGYLTILILLGLNLSAAFLAGFTKSKIREYKKKLMNKPTII